MPTARRDLLRGGATAAATAGISSLALPTAVAAASAAFTTGLGDSTLRMYVDATNTSSWSGSGSVWTDLTGNNHSLPVGGTGQPTFATTGLGIGDGTGAFVFSRSDAGVRPTTDLPDLLHGSSAAWTLAAWVRFSTLDGWQTILGIGDRNDNAMYFQKTNPDIPTEAIQVYGTSRGPNLLGLAVERTAAERLFCFHQTAVTTGTWYHVVATGDTSTVTLYVDGSAVQTVGGLGATPYRTGLAPATGTVTTTIGDRYDNVGDPLGGALAFLQVWSRALTAAEVADQYAATRAPYHAS